MTIFAFYLKIAVFVRDFLGVDQKFRFLFF